MTTFISYSRENSDFAVRLAKDLKAAGYDVWLDQLDIPTGARWDDELEKALDRCNSFLIILSPESIESQNVKDEIGYAIDKGKHILPVMIKQCEVPFRLRRVQYVDFTNEELDEYGERFEETKSLLSDTAQLPKATEAEKNISPGSASLTRPEAKKLFSTPMLLGTGAVVVVILIAVFILSGRKPATPIPTEAGTPTQTSAPTETTEPQVIVVTSTPLPTSTTPPVELTPTPQPFYTETFNGDLSNWSTFVTEGKQNKLNVQTENGNLVFDLGDINLHAYSVLNDFTYTDVKLEAVAANRGVNDNSISLVCRYSDGGWYEFNIGNDGTYTIFAYDAILKFYDPLAKGGSKAIKSGNSTNKYTAVCQGSTLSLWINDSEERTITVNQYNYDKGKVGLSVWSIKTLPVKVEFESLKISQP